MSTQTLFKRQQGRSPVGLVSARMIVAENLVVIDADGNVRAVLTVPAGGDPELVFAGNDGAEVRQLPQAAADPEELARTLLPHLRKMLAEQG